MKPKKDWYNLLFLKSIASYPALIFLVLSLFFGILFIFKLAPLNGTDEFTHFPRVYQISDGTLWERKLAYNQYGGYLPVNINTMINDYRNLSRESSGQQYASDKHELNNIYGAQSKVGSVKMPAVFTSVAYYPPWAYIPSILGVLFAKLLHLPLIWYVYMGRIFALLAWIALSWLAIRIIPSGKWFIVALALLPTSLTQAGTISADGVVNGTSWLLIALVLAIMAKSVSLTWRKLLLLSLLATYLCIIKDGYFLIALFPLVIPRKYFKSSLISKSWKSLTLLVVLLSSALLALRAKQVISNVVLTPTPGIYVNTKQQMHYMTHHLILFTMRALGQPFTKNFDNIYLGILSIITNRLIYLSILVTGLLAYGLYLGFSHTERIPKLQDYRKRLWMSAAVILIGTYLLICVSFYLGESQVGGSVINSIYGRYFLPLFPLLLVLPMTIKRRDVNYGYWAPSLITSISLVGLVATIMSIG